MCIINKTESAGIGWDESYERAREKVKEAEEESDLQTDEEQSQKRKRKMPTKFIQSFFADSSEEEESISTSHHEGIQQVPPPPPKLPLPSSNTSTPKPNKSTDSLTSMRTTTSTHSSASSLAQPTPSTSSRSNLFGGPPGAGNQGSMAVLMSGISQIITNQEKMKEEIRDLRRLVQRLAVSEPNDAATSSELPEGINFPIVTIEEMETIDDLLRDEEILKAVTKHLQSFCSTTCRESVFRIMREVLANVVAVNYNFGGHKSKRKFSSLQLMTAIYRCLSQNPTTRTTTKKEVEMAVQRWLAGARDREGGRKERAAQREPVGTQPDI